MVILWKQEKPQNISVHGRQTRTTASLEAYNCALNGRIRAKGNFYSFALAIIEEEFMKRTELAAYIESGGISGRREKRSVCNFLDIHRRIFHLKEILIEWIILICLATR